MSNPLALLQAYYQWRRRQPGPAPTGSPATEGRAAHWDAERGWLIVELRQAGRSGTVIVTGWADGIQCLTDWAGQPEILSGHHDPGLPLLDPRVVWAAPWRESIPADVRQLLARCGDGRWALLYWASHSRAALELLRSAPTLLWLLLLTAEQQRWPGPQIAANLRGKRRAILGACGLPATAAALNLLSKLRFERLDQDTLGWIHFALGDAERAHHLRHARTIRVAQLRFMQAFPALVSSPLVQAAPAAPGYFEALARTCADTAQLGQRLGREHPAAAIERCKTLAELRRLHDRWVDRLNRTQRLGARATQRPGWIWSPGPLVAQLQQTLQRWARFPHRYPAPPLPGTPAICPITTYRQLLQEGQTQRHCVAVYHDRIRAGHYYVYQVLAPERYTLGLSLEPGRPPRIDQLQGERNARVGEATLAAVQSWLNAAWPAPHHPATQSEPRLPDTAPGRTRDPVPAAPIRPDPVSDWLGACDLAIVVVCLESPSDLAQALEVLAQGDPADRLTVVVTPEPPAFKGLAARRQARWGRQLLRPRVDALLTVRTDAVGQPLGADWQPDAVQARLDETLTQIVKSITDTITQPGLVGVDFADVRAILKHGGDVRAAVGVGAGPQRAALAIRHAVTQLQAECALHQARGVLACITSGPDLAIAEFDGVGDGLRAALAEHADVVISMVIEADFPLGEMRVCVLAAGIAP